MNEYWLGTDESLETANIAFAKYQDYMAKNPDAMAKAVACVDDEEEDRSPYLSVVDGVGIITVQGSLLDGEFGVVGTWFGITGYGDIQKALVSAVSNPNVASIMLVIKSGGGAVAGCSETAKLVENVDKLKPVYTYSPTTMASAALWLGLASREVMVSSTTISGSIGTLSMLVSRHRMLKEDGIDAEVVRSGKYKALGHSAEPISDLAREEAQKTVQYLADLFLSYVAERRGVNTVAADTKFGQGRTFVGEQAVAVGLVDGVVSYTQAFLKVKSSAAPDNSRRVFTASIAGAENTQHNAQQPEGTQPMKHIPTPEQLAAMAAGVNLQEETSSTAPAQATTQEQAQPQADQASADLAAATAELATVKAELDAAKQALATAQAEVEASKPVVAEMETILRAAVKTMALPFNLDASAAESAVGADLVNMHKQISEQFKSKIKAGGVAAASRQPEEPAPTAAVNPLFLAAAQLKTRKGA